ncbi:MAG: hypothetical protein HGA47_15050, partial [Zoogloea sp.]|nr:hypothetical protein [Zoogloea sp.]
MSAATHIPTAFPGRQRRAPSLRGRLALMVLVFALSETLLLGFLMRVHWGSQQHLETQREGLALLAAAGKVWYAPETVSDGEAFRNSVRTAVSPALKQLAPDLAEAPILAGAERLGPLQVSVGLDGLLADAIHRSGLDDANGDAQRDRWVEAASRLLPAYRHALLFETEYDQDQLLRRLAQRFQTDADGPALALKRMLGELRADQAMSPEQALPRLRAVHQQAVAEIGIRLDAAEHELLWQAGLQLGLAALLLLVSVGLAVRTGGAISDGIRALQAVAERIRSGDLREDAGEHRRVARMQLAQLGGHGIEGLRQRRGLGNAAHPTMPATTDAATILARPTASALRSRSGMCLLSITRRSTSAKLTAIT